MIERHNWKTEQEQIDQGDGIVVVSVEFFISNEEKKRKERNVKPIPLEYTNVHYRDKCESFERYRRAITC